MKWTEDKIRKLSTEEHRKLHKEIQKEIKEEQKAWKEYKRDYDKKRYKRIKKNKYKPVKIKKYKKHDKYNIVLDGKECTECLDFKKWHEFPDNILAKDKKGSICKDCITLRIRYRRYTDYNFKMASVLRNRINQALKGSKKADTTFELIGCSIEELKKHLESQFQLGMNWGNHCRGGWHIDHIIPCATFDLTQESEQRKCFHYTNLKPLWAKENLKKGNKIIKK